MKRLDFIITKVSETEYEVQCPDSTDKVRVCLINRTHEDPTFSIALPGIGDSFDQAYKWQCSFPAVHAGVKTVKDALATVNGGIAIHTRRSMDDFAEAVYMAAYWLVKDNRAMMVASLGPVLPKKQRKPVGAPKAVKVARS